MSVLSRADIRPPSLAKRTVELPELGGEVVVRGMTLAERLVFGTAEPGADRYGAIAQVLGWCVISADGQPLMTREEWEAFGSCHLEACLRLFAVTQDLSLLTAESVEKKS